MTAQRWDADDLPDLAGMTAVVTGASSGIGLVTAGDLAGAGAHVVLAVRDVAKGETVARGMAGDHEVRQLDLTSLRSVREFASTWTGNLDILVNNAGIMLAPQGRTEDGFELHIGTNHLGHFALTNLLLPHLTGRVVTISSPLHARGHVDVDDLNWEHRRYNASRACANSKEANVLFTVELQRQLDGSGSSARAVCAHPGIARTNLAGHLGGLRGALTPVVLRLMGQDADRGALPTLYAATQDIPGNAFVGPDGFGHLRGHPELITPSPASQDGGLARRLWERSAELTDVTFPNLTRRVA